MDQQNLSSTNPAPDQPLPPKKRRASPLVILFVAFLVWRAILFFTESPPQTPQQTQALQNVDEFVVVLNAASQRLNIAAVQWLAALNEGDNLLFNSRSLDLLVEIERSQLVLTDARVLLADLQQAFPKDSDLQEASLLIAGVFDFRERYDSILGEIATIGVQLDFESTGPEVTRFLELLDEGALMEEQLPQIQETLVRAISRLDSAAGAELQTEFEDQEQRIQDLFDTYGLGEL